MTAPLPNVHEDFSRLYSISEPVLLRFIHVVLPNATDARDVLQQTALALWKKFEQYDPQKPFQQWAIGFASMEVKRFLRRQVSAERWISEAAAEQLCQQMSEQVEELETQRYQRLAYCLRQLPPRHQAMIRAHYFHNKTVSETASLTGTSTEAIYKGLQRVRQVIRDCLQG